ncbi:MAG: transrane transporter [Blastococcus sp.]|jgi:multiple sugar transport system permease protein|nr:transrane transporter [Blastococcus sp.]
MATFMRERRADGRVRETQSTSPGRAPRRRGRFTDRHFATLLTLPALLTVAAVTLVPILIGIGYSFTNYNTTTPSQVRFVGFDNYRNLFADPDLPRVLMTTFLFVVLMIGAETVLGLGLALLLERPMRGLAAYRVLYTMPLLTAGVVVAISWRYLLNGNFGWFNYLLGLLGIPGIDWLGSSSTALIGVVLSDMWVGVPLMAILLLAGLIGLDPELPEAAATDGASPWQIFRRVTLPGLAPVLTIAVIFRTVDAFRKFELIQLETTGGPGISTKILNLYIYQQGFGYGRLGYASAMSIFLVVLMVLALSVVFLVGRRLR